MHIENPEALKSWLSNILKPLCEADPSALAKYVLALAKKDKTEEELKISMINQLEVFLQKETLHFVDTLFDALNSKCYIPPVVKAELIIPDLVQENIVEAVIHNHPSPLLDHAESSAKFEHREVSRRSESDREDSRRGRKRTRSRGSSRSSSRSRSRSPRDKFRRSRSISAERTRSRNVKGRRSPRRTGYNRRRTPPYRRSRSLNRRSPARRSRSPVRTRARTKSPAFRHEDKPLEGAIPPPPVDVSVPPPPLPAMKQRCRDFDEKGFCMLGDLCPFDHGSDPVVVEDTELTRVLNFGSPPSEAPPLHLAPPVVPPPTAAVEPYNPDVPAIGWPAPLYPPPSAHFMQHTYQPGVRPPGHRPYMRRHGPTTMQPLPQPSHGQREPRQTQQDADMEEPLAPGIPDNRQRRPGMRNPNNCSLEVRKIPRGLNNIAQLNQHFSKFGRIVNLQVMHGGDPEAAVVTFSGHNEALTAYRSTEAVMNNRFIRVFWHNAEKQENIPPGMSHRNVKERLGPPIQSEDMDVETPQSTTFVKKEFLARQQEMQKAQELENIKKSQALLAAQEAYRKIQEQKKLEAAKLQQDLLKRKQELLDKHLEQQKILLSKFEKGAKALKKEERDTLIKTIKAMQESIESLRKEISTPLKRSVEDVQKDLLQSEIELQTRLMAPPEYAAAKQKVMALRKELALLSGAQVGRGAPGSRPRGRGRGGYLMPKISLDRRTTKLLISGFKDEESGDVLVRFSQYGDIVSHSSTTGADLIVEYKHRFEAETALKDMVNQEMESQRLSVQWYPSPTALKQEPVKTELRDEVMTDLSGTPSEEQLDYEGHEVTDSLSWKR